MAQTQHPQPAKPASDSKPAPKPSKEPQQAKPIFTDFASI